MGRIQTWMMPLALAVTVLACAAALAMAEEKMTFRPVPAESVAQLQHPAHVRVPAATGTLTISADEDSAGASGEASDDSIEPGIPIPPAPRRETTGEIVRFGSDIDIPRGQAVDGDVVSIGGDVRVEGLVKGSVTAMGGDVTLMPRSRVDGDVVCMGGTLHEEPGSSVGGQRVTAPRVPGRRLFLPMLAVVGTGVHIVVHLMVMLVMLGLTFLIVKLAPGRTQHAIDTIAADAGTTFLVGLLLWGLIIPSVIVLAIAMVILCITIIGIPVAAAVGVGYVAFFMLAVIWGSVVGAATLGGHLHVRLRGSTPSLMRAAVWGVVAFYGLRIAGDFFHVVPLFGFLGGLLGFIAIAMSVVLTTFGAGALVRSEYRRRTVQDWWQRSRPRKGGAKVEDDFPPPPPPPVNIATPAAPPPESM